MGNSITTQTLRSRLSVDSVLSKRRANRTLEIGSSSDEERSTSVLAELVWTALPQSLARALKIPAEKIWVDPTDQQGRFGLTILRDDSTGLPIRLQAWALVCQDDRSPAHETAPGSIRHDLFVYTAAAATTDPSANFVVLNGRPDRLSIDITDAAGAAVCRLSYLIQENGKAIWWGSSTLPEQLGLSGGRYELIAVIVNGLQADAS